MKDKKKEDKDIDLKIRDFMCQNFFDIRTFGAVMTTFVKAGAELRPGTRTGSAGLCAQHRAGGAARSHHHARGHHHRSGRGEEGHRDGP